MKRVLIIWPPKVEYVFSIQKHYTNFGETVAYLDNQPDLSVDVMDGTALLYFQWDFIKAYATEYDFLIVYTDLHNAISAIRAMQQCKDISPSTIAISYGQGTPYAPDTLIEQGFDAAVIDPMYQRSIVQYIRYRCGEELQDHLNGVYYSHDGRITRIDRKSDLDISQVAFPALHRLPVDQYKKISGRNQICFTVARGCHFSCRFCRVPVDQGHTVAYRPIEDVVEYSRQVHREFDSVKFIAPTFTADRDYVIRLCEEIVRADLRFKWIVTTRIELLDEVMLAHMSRAGCAAVAFGMETLYEDTQRRVDKHISQQHLTRQIELLHTNGIIPKAFIMLGIPGQTAQEIDDTYSYLRQHRVEIRPKEYYPYDQMFSSDDQLSLLEHFERNSVYSNRMPGVIPKRFIEWMTNRTDVR